jgi:hypothetical protein
MIALNRFPASHNRSQAGQRRKGRTQGSALLPAARWFLPPPVEDASNSYAHVSTLAGGSRKRRGAAVRPGGHGQGRVGGGGQCWAPTAMQNSASRRSLCHRRLLLACSSPLTRHDAAPTWPCHCMLQSTWIYCTELVIRVALQSPSYSVCRRVTLGHPWGQGHNRSGGPRCSWALSWLLSVV